MSDIVFDAPPRSGENIEDLADAVRKIFGLDQQDMFPVVMFVEKGLQHIVEGIVFDVRDRIEMGAKMGAVDPLNRALFIREDVYDGAVAGNGRDRFTVVHEVGHAVMHIGTLNRTPSTFVGKIPTYRDPEWQANRFAAALLMPRHLVRSCRTIAEIVARFGVSREAAENRVRTLKLAIK